MNDPNKPEVKGCSVCKKIAPMFIHVVTDDKGLIQQMVDMCSRCLKKHKNPARNTTSCHIIGR
jgi:hypothetical protein